MLNTRGFWAALMAAIVLLYAGGALLLLLGQPSHPLVRIAALVLLAHVLELPLAFRALRGREASVLRVTGATLAFGAAWWLPARRGLFAVA